MKVYQWSYDCENYDTITILNYEEFRENHKSDFKGEVIGFKWNNVYMETYQSRKSCDCTGLGNNIPIFSKHAIEVLQPYLESHVEMLPLIHPSKSYFAVNVIRLVDALDYDKASLKFVEGHSDFIEEVHQYAFKPELVAQYPIFKIPEFKRLYVFVTDTFKEAIEVSGLKGFEFELLWDSEVNNEDREAELERQYEEALAAIERNKGEEFSFDEAVRRIEAGESCASGQWQLQQASDGTIRLGNLQADDSYSWIQPIYYPPILLELKWHSVNKIFAD
ncbi:imm11 family protein [Paenibacillus aquistagni]|uniref:imm11 family protein n=1 Tax=Paenibacillus aquistagni TaxID=1852522 RepID=UPI000B514364|nr:DUF1629 domain-containing protein [Paenibacillus aquistagni]